MSDRRLQVPIEQVGLVCYDMPKKRSNQNKGDRNRDHGYEMLFLHSLSQLGVIAEAGSDY
jgi:hypothetical protein